ncbi:IVSP3-1-like protein [Lissonota sp. PSUC_FEM 10030012]|nr:IVSP3-1-like protein [Lissonota sp. PSUC_FEM 10030012]
MSEFDGNWSLRRILATWIHTHVYCLLNNDIDMHEHSVNLAIPQPGEDMYKFYAFVMKIEEILGDEEFRDLKNPLQMEHLKFEIPSSEQNNPIAWKHLRVLCRLIYIFNRIHAHHLDKLYNVMSAHTPGLVGLIHRLQNENPRLKSLVIAANGTSLEDTVKVHRSLDVLVHKFDTNNDERVNQLFNLHKHRSFVYVCSVIDEAGMLFEPICQFLPDDQKSSLDIMNLIMEKIPEHILRETLWKNMNVPPSREIDHFDVEFSNQCQQEIGAIAWEFICRVLAVGHAKSTIPMNILDKERITKFVLPVSLLPANVKDTMIDASRDSLINIHSIMGICALLIMSSNTLANCQCSSKTIDFVMNILAKCDAAKRKAKSSINAKVLAFAAHEMTKFPIVRPNERYHYRNLFSSYRQDYIFGRAENIPFEKGNLNEISFVHGARLGGLEIDHSTMLFLLASIKRSGIVMTDSLYDELRSSINSVYPMSDTNLNEKEDETFSRLRNNANHSVKDRISTYKEFTIFCLSYVLRMAYFTNVDVRASHLIPIVLLLDTNTGAKHLPITSACLQTFLSNLPVESASSANLTSSELENMRVGIRAVFKYLLLVLNVLVMEDTGAQFTLVDFIEHTNAVSLHQ